MSEQCRRLDARSLAFPARDRAGQARLVPDVLSALDGASRAGRRTCLQHYLHDGAVLADAPIGNGTGRHADLRAIERMPDALHERRSIEETRIRNPIACLCAGMALLNAARQRTVCIRFDAVNWLDGHLHVHDALSCNRPVA